MGMATDFPNASPKWVDGEDILEKAAAIIRCKDCKHWKHHGPGAVWGDCERLPSDIAEITVDMGNGMNDGYKNATLETHPDFGCVLGAAR